MRLGVLSLGVPRLSAERPVVSGADRFGRTVDRHAGVVADYEACACQVHVGAPDRYTGVAVLNHLRPWLRMVQQSRFPGSGVPPWFTSAADYDEWVDRMVECGTLVDSAMTFWLARLSPRLPTVELRAADAVPEVEDAVLQAASPRALV